MRNPGGRLVAILGLVVLLSPGAVPVQADGASQVTVRYAAPAGVAVGGFVIGADVGADGCANPCLFPPSPSRIGNPLVAVAGPVTDLTVQINDDLYGQLGATALCLSDVANGRCDDGDQWVTSRCGPYYLPGTVHVAEVVVVGLAMKEGPGGSCGATKGFLTVQWS